MEPETWEWPIEQMRPGHDDRVPILRTVPYEMIDLAEGKPAEKKPGRWRTGKALSLNVSIGGMLLLMEVAPLIAQRLRLTDPIPRRPDCAVTVAEVRWTRPLPFAPQGQVHFVGVKFHTEP